MQSIFKVIVFIGDLLGLTLFTITLLGLKKMLKEQNKLNKNEALSDKESERFKRYIFYMLIGFSASVITSLINLILIFRSRPL
jgi:hypothetical protein